MSASNHLLLIGRVGQEPDVRHLDNGKVVATFRLAVDRFGRKDKEGNQITDWFTCEFWGKQAELVGEIVQKGRLISVSGEIRIDEWTTEDGVRVSKPKVWVEHFHFLHLSHVYLNKIYA